MFFLDSTQTAIGSGTVTLMGLGTVFAGLIVIIFMCKLLGCIVASKKEDDAPTTVQTAAPVQESAPIQNKGELVAAISSAVAESLGKDVKAIRIISIKKV